MFVVLGGHSEVLLKGFKGRPRFVEPRPPLKPLWAEQLKTYLPDRFFGPLFGSIV